MGLRHLPEGRAEKLASLISCKPGQVCSKALSDSGAVDMTLLAFADQESVSEEAYDGDTLYYLVEGSARVIYTDGAGGADGSSGGAAAARLQAGDVLMVPAHVLHAIEGDGAFKVLQVTVR